MAISQRQFEVMVGLANRHAKTGPYDLAADQRVLLRATRLGRRGQYGIAATMLEALPIHSPLRPSVLDLKAKILAQQGRFLEAEACWREALALAPNHEGFRQALAAIAEERRYPFWLRIVVAAAVSAVTCVVLLLVAVGILRWAGWIGR